MRQGLAVAILAVAALTLGLLYLADRRVSQLESHVEQLERSAPGTLLRENAKRSRAKPSGPTPKG